MEKAVRELLTREEVAATGRCSRDTVDRAIQRGELEAVRVGRRLLVTREGLDRWIARDRASPRVQK